jgi:secreted trypsin-like serine protease
VVLSAAQNGSDTSIINGKLAKDGQFPWAVELNIETVENGQKSVGLCGGSLISLKWIVTAAHCFHGSKVSGILVRAGAANTNFALFEQAKSYKEHPKYNPKSSIYDVAVVELKTAFKASKDIKTVKISKTEPKKGDKFWAVGWGRLKGNTPGSNTNELRFVDIPFADLKTCQKFNKGSKLNKKLQFCLGKAKPKPPKDTCQGDSGGGVFKSSNINSASKNQGISGVVSFGPSGCPGVPGVYQKLYEKNTLAFITKTTKLKAKDIVISGKASTTKAKTTTKAKKTTTKAKKTTTKGKKTTTKASTAKTTTSRPFFRKAAPESTR